MTAPDHVGRVERVLDAILRLPDAPASLRAAMRYATLGEGKRVRPRLTYAAGRLAGAALDELDAAAAAVELVHAYSLTHDDLPAMDDDDLRRGRPTTHIACGEAHAILAGDALQALAFETLSRAPVAPAVAQRQVAMLARAAGAAGMVGGQVLDMEGETRRLSLVAVERVHRLKSGALIHAAVMMGAVTGALAEGENETLSRFAAELGLAFQIRDDVLGATQDAQTLGKPQGADARRGKSTYVSLLGVAGARAAADHRIGAALAALRPFGERGRELADLALDLAQRER